MYSLSVLLSSSCPGVKLVLDTYDHDACTANIVL